MISRHDHATHDRKTTITCTTIGHLQIMTDTVDGADSVICITYLGYSLLLSAGERCILEHLIRAMSKGQDNVSGTELGAHLPGLASDSTAAKVSVCVSRINKKALEIGGRQLILHNTSAGYRLNPFM